MPLKLKCSPNRYALVLMLFINMGNLSGMPYNPVQISSTSNAEERSPVSSSLSSFQQSRSVGDLLTSLFRQTIYNRIENLLLDPGRPTLVKRRIIDSAVRNYHNQQYSAPPPTNDEKNINSQNVSQSSNISISENGTSITKARIEQKGEEVNKNEKEHHIIDISTLAGKYFLRLYLDDLTYKYVFTRMTVKMYY